MYKPQSVFVLCDKCHWCVTWLDKTKMSAYDKCPQCTNSEMLSSFPILPDESFTFDYNHKRGAELGFEPREKRQFVYLNASAHASWVDFSL